MARTQGRDQLGDRLSLAALAEKIGKQPKTVDYNMFAGRRLADLDPYRLNLLADQCMDDVLLTYDLFDYFMYDCAFPKDELLIISETVKMFTSPIIQGDVEVFERIARTEEARKAEMLAKLGIVAPVLSSANQCAALLEGLGVELEYKPGKGGPIPALAKSDDFLQGLLEHPDEMVRAVAQARIDVKSTIVETRAQRFADISKRGAFPIYLRYCLDGDGQIIVENGDGWAYKALKELRLDDLVWDGEAFVEHRGLICRGKQAVIEWDGVVATPNHKCYDRLGNEISLSAAKNGGVGLMAGALPRLSYRPLENNRKQGVTAKLSRCVPLLLWQGMFSRHWQFVPRPFNAMQELCAAQIPVHSCSAHLKHALLQRAAPLHRSSAPRLGKIWRAGHKVYVQVKGRVYRLRVERTTAQRLLEPGYRQGEQRRALRAWKFAVSYSKRKYAEYNRLQGEEKVVYDIMDCGPQNKFVFNGKCVSNCGAHTTRWSGGDKQNAQNLTRKGDLRSGLAAPDGSKLLIFDYAQIEARLLLRLARQWDLLEYFTSGRDLYKEMASRAYGKPIEAITPEERGTGKQLVLSCGYGAGAATIQRTAKAGTYGPPQHISLEEADRLKCVYRESAPNVKQLWYWADDLLEWLLCGDESRKQPLAFRPPIEVDRAQKRVVLPNKLALHYAGLFRHEDGELLIKQRSGISRMYGGKFVENMVQALARVVVSDAILSMRNSRRLSDCPLVLTAHDELVFVVRDEKVTDAIELIEYHMTKEPKWLDRLPLVVEHQVSQRYMK